MEEACAHINRRCTLTRFDHEYKRKDVCDTCHKDLICEHFKLQKQVVRYGRDRYKPGTVANIVDEFASDDLHEFDLGDY